MSWGSREEGTFEETFTARDETHAESLCRAAMAASEGASTDSEIAEAIEENREYWYLIHCYPEPHNESAEPAHNLETMKRAADALHGAAAEYADAARHCSEAEEVESLEAKATEARELSALLLNEAKSGGTIRADVLAQCIGELYESRGDLESMLELMDSWSTDSHVAAAIAAREAQS